MRIDPHVHFRDEEQSHKETITHGLALAKAQGVHAVFDMPNTHQPIINEEAVKRRLQLVPESEKGRYYCYLGVTNDVQQLREGVQTVQGIPECIGLKMFAGHSTGNMGIIEEAQQQRVYETLAEEHYTGVLSV